MRSTTAPPAAKYASLSVKVDSPQAPPAAAEQPTYLAVLVCHGMGQQVQFETLDAVAREVREVARECGTLAEDVVKVSLNPDETGLIGRAELPLKRPDGSRVDVHFYEAYWAPLTEGRVTLRETLGFFVGAGWRGLGFALKDGVFDRWMFNKRQEFEIPVRRILQMGLALWILLLISAAYSALAFLPVMKLAALLRATSGNSAIAGLAALAFSIGILIIGSAVASAFIARALGKGPDSTKPNAATDQAMQSQAPPLWTRFAVFVVLLVVVAGTALAAAAIGMGLYRWLLPVVQDPAAHRWALVGALVAYVVEVVLFTKLISGFLIQFGGDVAAYISPYKVSKFEEIRRAIQERGRRIAKFIYSAKPMYDKVYVVGHSLGSVLAYDTLNDAVNRDTRAKGWGPNSAANEYNVAKRTSCCSPSGRRSTRRRSSSARRNHRPSSTCARRSRPVSNR
jgi:hypothetical protein